MAWARASLLAAPDWLLIYMLESGAVIFERPGTHADLFGSHTRIRYGWADHHLTPATTGTASSTAAARRRV